MNLHVLRNELPCLVAAVFCLSVALEKSSAADATPNTSSSSSLIDNESASSVRVFDDRVGRLRQVSAAEAAKIMRRYWTAQRQASAIPASAIADSEAPLRQSLPQEMGTPQYVAIPKLGRPDVTRIPNAAVSYTEGKVYFRAPNGNDYQCSGGAVNSGKRRLVWTAGHCVNTGPSAYGPQTGWMTNWMFIPGYDYGSRPAGTFPYYQLWGKNAWINDGDFRYDYGIAITWNNESGSRVVDAVGGNGLYINFSGQPFVTAIGYPANINIESQSWCQNWLTLSGSIWALDCNRLGGASGEPWMWNYSFGSGLGYIVSNNSFRTYDGPPVYGPYLDNAAWSLYTDAENASPN